MPWTAAVNAENDRFLRVGRGPEIKESRLAALNDTSSVIIARGSSIDSSKAPPRRCRIGTAVPAIQPTPNEPRQAILQELPD